MNKKDFNLDNLPLEPSELNQVLGSALALTVAHMFTDLRWFSGFWLAELLLDFLTSLVVCFLVRLAIKKLLKK